MAFKNGAIFYVTRNDGVPTWDDKGEHYVIGLLNSRRVNNEYKTEFAGNVIITAKTDEDKAFLSGLTKGDLITLDNVAVTTKWNGKKGAEARNFVNYYGDGAKKYKYVPDSPLDDVVPPIG